MLNLIELMYGVIFQYNKHYFWCLYYKLFTLFLHLIRFRSLFAQFNFETSTFFDSDLKYNFCLFAFNLYN